MATLKAVLVVSFLLFMVDNAWARCTKEGAEAPTAVARGQDIRIQHRGDVLWALVEYGTTDWRCKGQQCTATGAVTRHTQVFKNLRNTTVSYHRMARGPRDVSKIVDVEVLEFGC